MANKPSAQPAALPFFFRLRTRLLAASGLTLLLLALLVGLVVRQIVVLEPQVARLNALNTAALRVNDVSLYSRYAATDLSGASIGVLISTEQADDFSQQLLQISDVLDELSQSLGATAGNERLLLQITALRTAQTAYRTAGAQLFAAMQAQQSTPSAAGRAAADQALVTTSQSSIAFNQQLQALLTAVQAAVTAAEQQFGRAIGQLITAVLVLAGAIALVTMTVQVATAQTVGGALSALTSAAAQLGAGNTAVAVPVRRRDELGVLATTFNEMAAALQESRAAMEGQNQQLEATVAARTGELQRTVNELESVLSEQQRLRSELQAVSTPVLPVAAGVVLLPLIGELNEARTLQLTSLFLQAIERQRARVAILDITGLAVVSRATAQTLIQAAQAAQLLGATTIVAGVRPEVAQALILLDTDLESLHTVANLAAAVELGLRLVEGRRTRR